MTRFRIFLTLAITLALSLAVVVGVALTCAYRAPRPWKTLSPPAPDTLTGIRRLTISKGGEKWSFEVTDPAEIASFTEFVSDGTCETMNKSGYGYVIRVEHRDGEVTYHNHGDGLGPKPGGFIQTLFVPAKPGFQEWFEELLRQHGHPRRTRPQNTGT